jgi:hypothetical protein
MRKCGFDNIDKALMEWFAVQRDADFPINGPILKIQAEKFAVQLEHNDYSCTNTFSPLNLNFVSGVLL